MAPLPATLAERAFQSRHGHVDWLFPSTFEQEQALFIRILNGIFNLSMANSTPHEIPLRLADIQHLFHRPEADPFAGTYDELSGMQQILEELEIIKAEQPISATIVLPASQVGEDTAQRCQAAIRRYCDARIRVVQKEVVSLRKQGFQSLRKGLVFLGVMMVLSTIFNLIPWMPLWARGLFGEGFLIAGWVGLWHPTELLLYEWLPHRQDKLLYQRIREMPVTVVAQEEESV
jgi:hypothetical protein